VKPTWSTRRLDNAFALIGRHDNFKIHSSVAEATLVSELMSELKLCPQVRM